MTGPATSSRDWLRRLVAAINATTDPKSDAVAGMEDQTSPSGPFFAPAAASGAEHPILKLARAL
jgi:hypothetical protein